MTQNDLSPLTRQHLIDLVLAQAHQIEGLQKDNEALRLVVEQMQKPKPPTNSKNYSQPPSQDRKRKRSKEQGHKRHGPPKGHAQHVRPWVSQPDHVVEVQAQTCPRCDLPLELGNEQLVLVNQITELPEAKAEVIEVRQYALTCAHCQETMIAHPPVGLEPQRSIGPRLEAMVVYYRQQQHLSYQRTRATMQNLHGSQSVPFWGSDCAKQHN